MAQIRCCNAHRSSFLMSVAREGGAAGLGALRAFRRVPRAHRGNRVLMPSILPPLEAMGVGSEDPLEGMGCLLGVPACRGGVQASGAVSFCQEAGKTPVKIGWVGSCQNGVGVRPPGLGPTRPPRASTPWLPALEDGAASLTMATALGTLLQWGLLDLPRMDFCFPLAGMSVGHSQNPAWHLTLGFWAWPAGDRLRWSGSRVFREPIGEEGWGLGAYSLGWTGWRVSSWATTYNRSAVLASFTQAPSSVSSP